MAYGVTARYRELDVLSMSPGRRLVLLYTHLLSSLRQALAAIQAGRGEDRVARLLKAHQILEELRYTLDYDQGGEIAVNLGRLYDHFMEQILACSREPDALRLEGVVKCVAELHEAWDKIAAETDAAMPAASGA